MKTFATIAIVIASMVQFYQAVNFFDASAQYKAGCGRAIKVVMMENVADSNINDNNTYNL